MSTSSAKRPPDDAGNLFGASPEKATDVVVLWPVTVRVHTSGDYTQLVELLFVPDLKSKALRTAVLRYDARARARARFCTRSYREFKIRGAQAMFYAYGNDDPKNGTIWRGLVRIHSWQPYTSI